MEKVVEGFVSDEGAVVLPECTEGVVVDRGGGEEEVWRASDGRFDDAVTCGERSGERKMERRGRGVFGPI